MKVTNMFGICLLLLISVCLVYQFFSPPTSTARVPTSDSLCRNYLKAIGLAFHNYHDTYGSLPPAYVTDASGQHRHSWRVLLLPFLDQQNLYDQYRFDEPWDSEHNLQLQQKLDGRYFTYHCPLDSDSDKKTVETNYLAVVGEQTAWRGEEPVTFEEIEDGLAETMLVVEVQDSGIGWAEPRDLLWDEMSFRINDFTKPSPRSPHNTDTFWFWEEGEPFVHVLMADGSALRFRPETSPQVMKALLTIQGGEKKLDVREVE